jgi:putative transposase
MEVSMNKRHVKHIKPVDSAQVRSALVRVLTTYIPLDVDARDLDEATAWNILLYASVHQTTIEATCLELDGPSGTTTRDHLTAALGDSPRDVLALEEQLNQALRAQLPRSFRRRLNSQRYDVAIDLVDLPYYGQAHRDAQEVRRGPAKAGTTYFHSYATIAIVHDDERYELALTFVWAKESLTEIVLRLLKSVRLLGVRIRCAYLDKGFSRVEIFRLLRRHRIPYVVPVPLRGHGLRALCHGRRSYQTRYTFNAKTADAYTTDLVLVRRYRAGRRGRHGVDWLVYAVYGLGHREPHQIHQLYRWRFGIESGYRQMHQVRARTTSRHPGLRLLLVGLALLLLNCYMALRQVWLTTRQYGRRVYKIWLTLQRLARLLVRVIEHLLGTTPVHQVAFSKIELDPIS